jgi:hypothetical protein
MYVSVGLLVSIQSHGTPQLHRPNVIIRVGLSPTGPDLPAVAESTVYCQYSEHWWQKAGAHRCSKSSYGVPALRSREATRVATSTRAISDIGEELVALAI